MLMHTREGTTIVTQQQKVKNETWQQFISKALLCSILPVVYIASLLICDGQFSFSHRASQVEPSPLLLDTISKSSTLPWKNWQQTASWSFSWSFSPATIDLQKSPCIWRSTSRDFVARQKSLPRSLRNSLNSIPWWFQWFLRSFVIF